MRITGGVKARAAPVPAATPAQRVVPEVATVPGAAPDRPVAPQKRRQQAGARQQQDPPHAPSLAHVPPHQPRTNGPVLDPGPVLVPAPAPARPQQKANTEICTPERSVIDWCFVRP